LAEVSYGQTELTGELDWLAVGGAGSDDDWSTQD